MIQLSIQTTLKNTQPKLHWAGSYSLPTNTILSPPLYTPLANVQGKSKDSFNQSLLTCFQSLKITSSAISINGCKQSGANFRAKK